jgi:NAD(P)H-flavin reductase
MEDRAQGLMLKMVPNIYLPHPVSIKEVKQETVDIKTFTLHFQDEEVRNRFTFRPGQFLFVSVFNFGEAPISICSSPTFSKRLQLSIKKVGALTGEIHRYSEGDEIGVRGPYGNGFPLERLYGNNLLFVGGGIGLAPLRSLIQYVFANRLEFGRVTILYGARTPGDIVFKKDLRTWAREKDVEVLMTVDKADSEWKGETGPVTHLWQKTRLSPSNTKVIICGPPVMISYVVFDLLKMGFAEEDIISTLERNMKCGVGKCGHCSIGSKLTCIHGPVFTYQEMKVFPSVW